MHDTTQTYTTELSLNFFLSKDVWRKKVNILQKTNKKTTKVAKQF